MPAECTCKPDAACPQHAKRDYATMTTDELKRAYNAESSGDTFDWFRRLLASEHLGRHLPAAPGRDLVHLEGGEEGLQHRLAGIERGRRVLEDRLHAPAQGAHLPAAEGGDRLSLEEHLAARRSDEAQDEPHQRRAPRSRDFRIRPSYWCAIRCDWICAIVSMVTETTIRRLVPPK